MYITRLKIALHVSVVLMVLSLCLSLFDNSLFCWHPVLMSAGYLLFMSEGIIAAIMFRHIDGHDRVHAIWGHAWLQLRSVLCIAAGFAAIYRNKVLHGKTHFHSLHAKVGLATLILSVLSPLWGLLSFKRLGVIQKFPEKWHPWIKWSHRQMGVLCWLLALVTIQLALRHPAVDKGLLTNVWQVAVAVIGGLMLMLLIKAWARAEEDVVAKAV
ncbi:cytochrome b-561-like protein [Haematococcus lacustris]